MAPYLSLNMTWSKVLLALTAADDMAENHWPNFASALSLVPR